MRFGARRTPREVVTIGHFESLASLAQKQFEAAILQRDTIARAAKKLLDFVRQEHNVYCYGCGIKWERVEHGERVHNDHCVVAALEAALNL